MSYNVVLTGVARERLLACRHADVAREAARRLHRLGTRDLRGRPLTVGPLTGVVYAEFRINRLPLTYRIGVAYVFEDDEQTIDVLDFGIQRAGEKEWREPNSVCPGG